MVPTGCDDVSSLFRLFRNSHVLPEVESVWSALKAQCESDGMSLPNFLRKHAKDLWNLLNEKRRKEEYTNAPCQKKRIVVIGGEILFALFTWHRHTKCFVFFSFQEDLRGFWQPLNSVSWEGMLSFSRSGRNSLATMS
jgi:hypothetical protein